MVEPYMGPPSAFEIQPAPEPVRTTPIRMGNGVRRPQPIGGAVPYNSGDEVSPAVAEALGATVGVLGMGLGLPLLLGLGSVAAGALGFPVLAGALTGAGELFGGQEEVAVGTPSGETGVFYGGNGHPVVNGVPISGPGVPEPPRSMVAKEWRVKVESQKYGTFQMYYWMLTDGRMMSYHSPTKTWKIWKPKKHIVISRDPRVSMLRKLGSLNKRVEKMLKPFQPKVKRGFPARALAGTYLSTAEKKLLRGGT